VDGPTPYRAGKPLAEIIPPDRRRAKALALVLASMAVGVVLWVLGGMVLAPPRDVTPRPIPTTPIGNPPDDPLAPLDAEAVRRVVASHAPDLKRACWERRLAEGDGPSAASVTVTATIGGDGKVEVARATGDDAPLRKCIEAEVTTWRFPASGAAKTVSLPFHFAKE
jgi:hypothetical protein